MRSSDITVEARVRARNQLTIPDAVVQVAGIGEGDRFMVEVSTDDPDTIRLHRIRPSYAGALRDLYGNDVASCIDAERQSWG